MSIQAMLTQLTQAFEQPSVEPPSTSNPVTPPLSGSYEASDIEYNNGDGYSRAGLLPNLTLSSAAILDSRPRDDHILNNQRGDRSVVGSRAALDDNHMGRSQGSSAFGRPLGNNYRSTNNMYNNKVEMNTIVETGTEGPTTRKRRRTGSDENGIKAPSDAVSKRLRPRSRVSPRLSTTFEAQTVAADASRVEQEEPSLVQLTPSINENNSQILDFQVRVPNPAATAQHKEVMSTLNEILQQVKEINSKMNNMPLTSLPPKSLPLTPLPEREAEQASGEHLEPSIDPPLAERLPERASEPLQSLPEPSQAELPQSLVEPSPVPIKKSSRSSKSPATVLRAHIRTHFPQIRAIVEEVAETMLSNAVRLCKVCHKPYSVQRNKDVLQLRCRNSKVQRHSVYGGKVPEHVLDRAWEVIEERGLDHITKLMNQSQQQQPSGEEYQDQESGNQVSPLTHPSSPDVKLSPEQESPSEAADIPMAETISTPEPEPEQELAVKEKSVLEAEPIQPKFDPNSTDARIVGMEVAAQMLPAEMLKCRVCGSPWTLNRNNGALEFRCRNRTGHNVYGGRVPQSVMDRINQVIRQRQTGEPVSDSSQSIPVRSGDAGEWIPTMKP